LPVSLSVVVSSGGTKGGEVASGLVAAVRRRDSRGVAVEVSFGDVNEAI